MKAGNDPSDLAFDEKSGGKLRATGGEFHSISSGCCLITHLPFHYVVDLLMFFQLSPEHSVATAPSLQLKTDSGASRLTQRQSTMRFLKALILLLFLLAMVRVEVPLLYCLSTCSYTLAVSVLSIHRDRQVLCSRLYWKCAWYPFRPQYQSQGCPHPTVSEGGPESLGD